MVRDGPPGGQRGSALGTRWRRWRGRAFGEPQAPPRGSPPGRCPAPALDLRKDRWGGVDAAHAEVLEGERLGKGEPLRVASDPAFRSGASRAQGEGEPGRQGETEARAALGGVPSGGPLSSRPLSPASAPGGPGSVEPSPGEPPSGTPPSGTPPRASRDGAALGARGGTPRSRRRACSIRQRRPGPRRRRSLRNHVAKAAT